MRRLHIFVAALCSLGLFVAEPAPAQQTDANEDPCRGVMFNHADLSEEYIYTNFGRAILRIEVISKTGTKYINATGTGYLIDTEQGYVITAFHVIEAAAGQDSSFRITATIPEVPDLGSHSQRPNQDSPAKFDLDIVEPVDSTHDVALLKITDTSALVRNGVPALEIALEPREGARYFTMGYPDGSPKLQKQRAELEGESRDSSGYYDVKQDVTESDSGSPLIDQEGAVVATLTNFQNSIRALYRPLYDVQKLFDSVRIDSKVDLIDGELLNARVAMLTRQNELIKTLKWIIGNPSNLELYEWAHRMSANQAVYKSQQSLMACPILHAYYTRRLAGAYPAQSILAFARPIARAGFLLSAASHDLLLREPIHARDRAQQAAAIFRDQQDAEGEARALTYVGVASLHLHDFDAASKILWQATALQPAPPDRARIDVYLAQAYAGRGDASAASRYIDGALPKLRQYGDRDGEAIAYETLGRLAENNRDYVLAVRDFEKSGEAFQQSGNKAGETDARARAKRAQYIASGNSYQHFVTRHPVLGLIIAAVVVFGAWFIVRKVGERRAK